MFEKSQRKIKEEPVLLHPQNEDFIRGLAERPASLSGRGFLGCMLLFFIPFLMGGTVLWVATAKMIYDNGLLNHDSALAEGQLIDKRTYYDEGDHYNLTYAYDVLGVTYEHTQQIDRDIYQRFQVGDRVIVQYANPDPTIARLNGTHSDGMMWFLIIFASLWSIFVVIGMVATIGGGWRDVQLGRVGILIVGRLRHIETTRDSDGDVWTEVIVNFMPPEGVPITDKRSYRLEPKKIAHGDPVAIFYRNPKSWEVL